MQTQKSRLSKSHTTYTIKKHGLTLIEVMIAIFIFGIGILGVLQIMTQNIGLMDRAKLRTQAVLFAQEAMELSFHHRDTNTMLGYNWACMQRDNNLDETSGCSQLLTSGSNIYTIEQNSEGSYNLSAISFTNDFNEIFEKGRLYLHKKEIDNQTIEIFNHVAQDGIATNFARIIQFDPIEQQNIPAYLQNKIIKTTVSTFYMKGSMTGGVVLESFLGERVY